MDMVTNTYRKGTTIMPKQIAVAGKGGTGKTTLAALIIRYITEERPGKSILAVDADANANLNEALGFDVINPISEILTETKDPKKVPTGMTKDMFVEYRLHTALAESDKYDLIVMGNPQGPGCYCFPSDLLRKHLENLRDNYDYVVIDNEAGLEHLSRRIMSDIDTLLVASDSSARGVRSARRVHEIVKSVDLDVKQMGLVISRIQKEGDVEALKEEIEKTGLSLLGKIPMDLNVSEFDLKGIPLFDLPADSPAYVAVKEMLDKMDI